MPAFAYDETIRIPRLPTGPVRTLQRQFAPVRARRWPWLLAIGALAAIAIADPVDVPQYAQRTAQAQELLRLLGR